MSKVKSQGYNPAFNACEDVGMNVGTIVVLVLLVVLVAYVIGMYNGLVAGRNRFKNAFAQIDVQLQRRYDLIPNLVEAAKGYMSHERDTLEAVMAARNQAQSAARGAAAQPEDGAAIGALSVAEGALGGALGRFYAVAEAYPDLKANTTITDLMEELTSSENKVAFARQHFNDAVTDYNNRREQFPTNVIAGMFNFQGAQLLVLDNPAAREAPKVLFR
jgi:LemA protein